MPLEKIEYVDDPEIIVNKHERIEMPFRYVKGDDGQPIMPAGMVDLIKKDADKAVDDLFWPLNGGNEGTRTDSR